jgi:hypothetical protein
MQYRTPGRTVTIELSSGQSRTGIAGWGDFHPSDGLQPALAPLAQSGVTEGASICRSRPGGVTANPANKSTIASNDDIPGPLPAPYFSKVNQWLPHG